MQIRSIPFFVACSLLAACGGGGTATPGAQAPTQDVSTPTADTTEDGTVIGTGTDAPNDETDTADVTTPSTDGTTTPDGATPTTTGSTPTVDPVTGEPTPPPAPVIPPEPISFFSFDASARSTSAGSGLVERANGAISLSDLSGTLSADGTMIILDGGGQITLIESDQTHVALYQAEPTTGSPSFGVYGQATDFTSFSPDGTATFTGLGTAIVQIIDDSNVYDLVGDIEADVNFDTDLVDLAISGLQGQRSDGLSTAVEVSDAAQIGITGGRFTDGTFEGGVATFASATIASTLSGAEVVASNGGLFGDAGAEIGGVFVIDDTGGAGNLFIQGQYIGD